MIKNKDYWREKKREQRAKAKAAKVDEVVVARVEKKLEAMTETDVLFEMENPGYWVWMEKAVKRECMVCEKPFETRLELNRFCGPECKREMIGRLSTMEVAA